METRNTLPNGVINALQKLYDLAGQPEIFDLKVISVDINDELQTEEIRTYEANIILEKNGTAMIEEAYVRIDKYDVNSFKLRDTHTQSIVIDI